MIKKICEVITKINKLGYKAYLIGGSSRDYLLSRSFLDVDITTNAPINILEANFKVIDEKGKSLGSIKIEYKNLIIEITRFRKESYDENNIYPHIEFVNSEYEDALRRDFTINAIYLNIINNQIIDPFNGLNDLMAFKVKFIGNPEDRIKEDPTRIIRALRISNKLNFNLENNTNIAIKENIKELKKIPIKKYQNEIIKTIQELGIEKAKKIFNEYNMEVENYEY